MLNTNTEKTTINIVTACDNAYVQHTTIFLKSLFAKNPDIRCRIFVLVPDNFIHHRSLERNLGSYWRSVEFLNINRSDTSSFKVSLQVTVATYFRLFLDKLMPADINRVIYMDSDILIAGPLEDFAVAAAIDAVLDNDLSVRQKIRLASTSHYFNAGVLLIDLIRWRNEKLGERALAFAVEYPELITWWDQCALNHVLNGHFKELTKDWNFQTPYLRRAEDGKWSADTLVELNTAKIIHFTGQLKPWYYLADHPMKWLYWEILSKTEWRDYCPSDRTRLTVLKKTVENRAPALLNAARRARKLWRATVG
jgi:lipopolysaccharide biosynthesis glycosyltransferase